MITYYFIINATAGGGKAGKCWKKLKSAFQQQNIAFAYALTSCPGDATRLASAAYRNGQRHFAILGGDGSFNEVLNGLMLAAGNLSDVTMTVIPCGTGNDWAAMYAIPHRPQAVIRMLQQPTISQMDLGQVDYTAADGSPRQHYFHNFVGTGFDSFLLNAMGSAKGQRWRYFYYVLRCLKQFQGSPLNLHIEGENISCKALMLMCCNGKYGGAGMTFAPDATADDGLFNIICIEDLPFLERLKSLLYLFNGKINQHPAVRTWVTNSLEISSPQHQRFQCDGELIGDLRIVVSLHRHALNILHPGTNET